MPDNILVGDVVSAVVDVSKGYEPCLVLHSDWRRSHLFVTTIYSGWAGAVERCKVVTYSQAYILSNRGIVERLEVYQRAPVGTKNWRIKRNRAATVALTRHKLRGEM